MNDLELEAYLLRARAASKDGRLVHDNALKTTQLGRAVKEMFKQVRLARDTVGAK